MTIKFECLCFLCGLVLLLAGCSRPLENLNRVSSPGETVFFVPNAKKMVALTFDDGPNGVFTARILDALHESRAPASFFVLGSNAERYPDLIKRIAAEGHLIGNHTFRHSRFDQVTKAEMEKDIADGSIAIEALTGMKPRWFRPPYGINGEGLEEACRRQGLVIAGWSLDANDWNPHPVEELVEAIVSQVTPGDIILLHDGWETRPDADRHLTAAAVPVIIDKLRQAGFVLVTLPELQRNTGVPLAVFENGIRLLGLQIPGKPLSPGGEFGARYFWDVPDNLPGTLPSAFVHFRKIRSKYFFQDDHDLNRRGDVRDLVVRRAVVVPSNAPAGKFEIMTGLFPPDAPETKDRLKVRSDFPQAQRAVYLPQALEILPLSGKPD
jgi:peptidoglycan/xylan/chitin deacetylase (PgdA/CDA1 family)